MVSAIILRSAFEPWNVKAPADCARIEVDRAGHRRYVSWAEVHKERQARDARNIAWKRDGLSRPRRLWRLWVAYFDTDFFGGWHAFYDRPDERREWLTRYHGSGRSLNDLIPLVLTFGEDVAERWMREFARRFERRRQAGRPVGVRFVWRGGDLPDVVVQQAANVPVGHLSKVME